MKPSDVEEFLSKLRSHADRKAKLYDGINATMTLRHALTLAAEELGEVASEIERERIECIKAECIDLAHCAMLIYGAVSDGDFS